MTQRNIDIRFMCRTSGVPLWRLAEVMHIGRATLYRRLNKGLDDAEREKILLAIRTAAEQKEEK